MSQRFKLPFCKKLNSLVMKKFLADSCVFKQAKKVTQMLKIVHLLLFFKCYPVIPQDLIGRQHHKM